MLPVLIDTHVLIYALDARRKSRQARAIRVLQQLQLADVGRLSMQCLSEFASVSTRKLIPPLTWDEAYAQVELLVASYEIYHLTPQIVVTAVRGARDYRLAYYDAQIWATALLNQVPVIFSEDFADGASLEGVRLVNPFADEFVLENWA